MNNGNAKEPAARKILTDIPPVEIDTTDAVRKLQWQLDNVRADRDKLVALIEKSVGVMHKTWHLIHMKEWAKLETNMAVFKGRFAEPVNTLRGLNEPQTINPPEGHDSLDEL